MITAPVARVHAGDASHERVSLGLVVGAARQDAVRDVLHQNPPLSAGDVSGDVERGAAQPGGEGARRSGQPEARLGAIQSEQHSPLGVGNYLEHEAASLAVGSERRQPGYRSPHAALVERVGRKADRVWPAYPRAREGLVEVLQIGRP